MKRILAFVLTFLAFAGHAVAAEKIKIGLLVSLTGTWSLLGAEQERGMRAALKNLGGKMGGIPIEIIVIDDQSKPNIGVQNAKKLIELHKVDVITGATASSTLVAIAKPISDTGTFLISGNAGPSPLAGKGCLENVFVASWQNDSAAAAIGAHMSKVAKKVYFLGANYQAGWDWVKGAIGTFKGKTAAKRFVPLGTVDFSSVVAQIRSSKADGVYAFVVGSALVAFVKQYDRSGMKRNVPLYSGMFLADDLTFKAQGKSAIGLVLSTHWYPNMDNAANKKFTTTFRSMYGRNPAMYAQQQYDAFMLIDSAVRAVKGKIENKKAFRTALRAANFQSTRGKFSFNNNHFPVQDYFIVKVVKNSKGKLEHKLVATALKDFKDPYAGKCAMRW